MVEFISDDKTVMGELRDDNYDIDAMMADSDNDADMETAPADEDETEETDSQNKIIAATEVTSEVDPNWKDRIEVTEKGIIKNNVHNLLLILEHDPRFRGCIAYNDFLQEPVLVKRIRSKQYGHDTGPVRDKENGDFIEQHIETALRAILESPRGQGKSGYSLRVTDRDMKDAVNTVALAHRFHPVQQYLRSVRWDGKPRVDELFSTYCGAESTLYHRAVAHNALLGAVARAFEPGCKFDFVVIIEGRQGIRKSTMLNILAGRRRFGELRSGFDDQAKLVEAINGRWIVEIPELTQFSRHDVEVLKAVFSAQADRVRLAWGRSAKNYPRGNVFWGTTNRKVYLRDDENRRYWPVKLGDKQIKTEKLSRDVDQIWAEAYQEYLFLRRQTPDLSEPLPIYLQGQAAVDAANQAQQRTSSGPEDELTGQIMAWLDTPVPQSQAECGWRGDVMEEDVSGEKLVLRQRICLKDITFHVLGKSDKDTDMRLSKSLSQIMGNIPGWTRHGALVKLRGPLGPQRVYERDLDL